MLEFRKLTALHCLFRFPPCPDAVHLAPVPGLSEEPGALPVHQDVQLALPPSLLVQHRRLLEIALRYFYMAYCRPIFLPIFLNDHCQKVWN